MFFNELQKSGVGTLDWTAPEIVNEDTRNEGYDKKCDVWSVGVCAYFLLSGESPFSGNKESDTVRNIISNNYDITNKKIPAQALEWITLLLEPNPKKRITIEEALKHEWISENQPFKESSRYHQDKMLNLRFSTKLNEFQYNMLNQFIKHLDDDEIKENVELFKHIDKNHSGSIKREEFFN